MTVTRMVDVASYQHGAGEGEPIDWCAVAKAGIGAVMVKATESPSYVNPWLKQDVLGALGAGLRVGVYHFAHPERAAGAASEAKFPLATLGGLGLVELLKPPNLGVALDLEINPSGLSWEALGTFADDFVNWISAYPLPAPLYTMDSWLPELAGAPWHHKLWLAAPGRRPRFEVWAWQSGTGFVDGFPPGVVVDVDELYG